MRIAHVESGRHLYGGARQVGYLVAGLAARGVENALVCPPGHPLAVRCAPVASIVELPMGGDLDVTSLGRLRRALTALEPDIVHVHSRRGADLYAGRACKGGPQAVLTRRVDSAEPPAWLRFKCRPYARIVAISSAVETDLCVRAGIDPLRVRRIASAVDTQAFRPRDDARARVLREFGLGAESFPIAVAAQLIARKGHATLLHALPDVVRRHPQAQVVCFGRGPLRGRLERLVDRLGLARHVRFAGFREDLPALLPGFDLAVHPALREGLGVAVLEALSAGVPVVATAVGGVVDALTDGREGLLVAAAPAALAAAIERLVEDAPLRRRLGAAGRMRMEREFSVARMVDSHLELYRDVHAQRHAALRR